MEGGGSGSGEGVSGGGEARSGADEAGFGGGTAMEPRSGGGAVVGSGGGWAWRAHDGLTGLFLFLLTDAGSLSASVNQ